MPWDFIGRVAYGYAGVKVGGRSTAVTGVGASVRAGRPFTLAAGTSPVGGGSSSSPRGAAIGSGAGGGASDLLSASISSFTRLARAADADGFHPPASGTGVGTSARTVRITPPALNADSTGTGTTGIGPDGEEAGENTGRCGWGASHAASSETSESATQSSKPWRQVRLSGPISPRSQ